MPDHPAKFALASSRIVTPEGVRSGAVLIADGKIEAVVSLDEVPTGVQVEDLGDLVISPGLVDAHVHINEPGRTEWEGFETATRAAAAGGVTTLVDMPLNSTPVTTTVTALDAKRQAAEGKCWVDVGFHGGLVPGNLEHIEPLIDAGVCGIKAFMCDSGLPEFPASGDQELRQAGEILARRDVPLLVHAELVNESSPQVTPTDLSSWVASRPDWWEFEALRILRHVTKDSRVRIHIVHLSSKAGAGFIKWAQHHGHRITAETCPHYLHFFSEAIQDADTRFKCAPPIRSKDDRERLWSALVSGVIDTIGSDHSPCPPEMKCLETGDWQKAWGGISSLQLTLPIVWRGACSRMVPFARLAEWLSSHPARLVGLDDRKGRIAAGLDADLCIWDPEEEWTVRGEELQHRHKVTAYEGERLLGRVKRTYVRGRLVFDDGGFPAGPVGQLLRRGN